MVRTPSEKRIDIQAFRTSSDQKKDTARGKIIIYCRKASVRIAENVTSYNSAGLSTPFLKYVAIDRHDTESDSIEYKSIQSFLHACSGQEDLTVESMLKLWIACMIDKGLSPATRQRYFGKLHGIYNEYCAQNEISGEDPFDAVKKGLDGNVYERDEKIFDLTSKLTRSFNTIMTDAESRPALAVFLHLLFNASADVDSATELTVSEYKVEFPQLANIINPMLFHHRRKYVFDLNQSRKRTPQLVREVTQYVGIYLRSKGLDFNGDFQQQLIPAIWTAMARSCGITLREIRSILKDVPEEFSYLELVEPAELSDAQRHAIKSRVAESFAPSNQKWFVMKIRRNVEFGDVQSTIKEKRPDVDGRTELFYPIHEVAKRKGSRLIKETVPFIPDVVFFKTLPRYTQEVDTLIKTNNLGWVFRTVNKRGSDFSIIDTNSMLAFERAVGQLTSDMKIDMTDLAPVGIGREVRITGGMMAGYTGKIYDIKEDGDSEERLFYIKLSSSDYLKIEAKVEEMFIEPID